MTGNLIGENFDPYVFEQINQRQLLYGRGYEGGASTNITTNELSLINNNSSFLKLASGVNIFQPQPEVTKSDEVEGLQNENVPIVGPIEFSPTELFSTAPTPQLTQTDETAVKNNNKLIDDINDQIKKNNANQLKGALNKLKNLGFSPKEIESFRNGNALAKSAVLFNGLSSLSGTTLKQREGIAESLNVWNSSSVYGLGGNKFGKQPMPGLISADIKCINRGSIRSANIKIKAYNQFQFNLLELLYMRLGYTMLLEWGHVNYLDQKGKKQTIGTTLTEKSFFNNEDKDQREVLDEIQDQRIKYQGNVDAFFGRVTNFSWKFSSDGTYDIDLELYTLGDVVESLTVNVPVSTPSSTGENALKVVGNYTILDKWMDSYIATYGENAVSGGGKYINIPSINYAPGGRVYKQLEGWDKDNKYYCTFKELLSKIVEHCIPLVVGKTTYPMVNFDLGENLNIVSAQPNQISFDLEKVFIKPDLYIPNLTPLATLKQDYLKTYFVKDKDNDNDLYYGQIMNLYLNFKFIKSSLIKNIDSDGNLGLYNFLVSICDGINSSLGDVNKIQPIIKDGNTIVIIDQVQPKGNSTIIKKLIPTVEQPKSYPLELYGFNGNKSNFIFDFSFESKIDSKLSTSLAIGATAGNSQTSLTDGTAFSTWNTGLQDRFSKQIIPASNTIDEAALIEAEKKETDIKLEELWAGDNTFGHFDWFGDDTRSGTIGRFSFKRLTLPEFKTKYTQFINQNPILQTKEDFESAPKGLNYASLLAKNIGGTLAQGIAYNENDATYLNIVDKNNYSQLKQYFKSYIQQRDEKIYRITNTASQREGFIPLSLNITLLGLSGIKIYQKLPIVTKFLPSQYFTKEQDTLNFIIQNVDHSISNNKWETKISTLSIPPSATTNVNIIDDTLFSFLGVDGPNSFDSYVKATAWSACFISYLASSNNVRFPVFAAHWQYCQSIRAGNEGWTSFDPREASPSSTYSAKKRQLSSRTENNKDTVYGDNSYKSVQIGDIIVKNREGNNLKYSTEQFSGATHGDIVTEINEDTIAVIGGNVSDTVKKEYYTITKDPIGTDERFITISTNGAIKITGEAKQELVFIALRCDDQSKALLMVEQAKKELALWSSKGWKDDNPESFTTLTKYYDAANLFYPTEGIPASTNQSTTS